MLVHKKADELVEVLSKTSEFRDLQNTQKEIVKNSTLKKQLDEYQTKRMNLFSKNSTGKHMENSIKQLEKEFESLSKIPEVKAFLEAGKEFNDVVAKTHQYILEQLDKKL